MKSGSKSVRQSDPVTETRREELTLRIVLRRPTAGVDFGLQKGHGSTYETVLKQTSMGTDLEFEFTVKVKRGKDGAPDFSGPFAQGPAGERFVYIDIGTYAGQTNTPWSRRLKIPLSRINWDLIDLQRTLVAEVPGTGKDGGPTCAYAWRREAGESWGWKAAKE